MIRFLCTCGQSISTNDGTEGRQVKCPGCGLLVIIPGGRPSQAPIPTHTAAVGLPPGPPQLPRSQTAVWRMLGRRDRQHVADANVVRVVDVSIPFWSVLELVWKFAWATLLVGFLIWAVAMLFTLAGVSFIWFLSRPH
jgi:hypothetical protein